MIMQFSDIPLIQWIHANWPIVVSLVILMFTILCFLLTAMIDSKKFITSKDLYACKQDVEKNEAQLLQEIKEVSAKLDRYDETNRAEHRQIGQDVLMLSTQWSHRTRQTIAQRLAETEERVDG